MKNNSGKFPICGSAATSERSEPSEARRAKRVAEFDRMELKSAGFTIFSKICLTEQDFLENIEAEGRRSEATTFEDLKFFYSKIKKIFNLEKVSNIPNIR